jgi:hypothetical protein
MSKKASPALFELIKSMSKSEKRYFKILSSRHTIGEENNYITLFDHIEQMTEYDEEKLFEHFSGEAFLNQFSITKNRLYESIMKSLDAFHSNSSIDTQIARMIHGAEILYNKSLYDHARRQLLSAERLAKKHDKHSALYEINLKYAKLIETANYSNTTDQDIKDLSANNEKYIEQLIFHNELWRIKSQLFMLINKKGKVRSDDERKNYEAIFVQLNKLKTPKQIDFESTYLQNHILSAYYYAILDDKNSLKYALKNEQLLKKYPERIKQEPNTYFSIITNIVHLYSKIGDYKNALIELKHLKSFPKEYKIELNQDLEIKFFASVYSTELMLYVQQAEFNKALELEAEILEGLRLYKNTISPVRKAYLYFQLAIAAFGMEEYSKSLKWTNTILNDSNIDDKEDICAFTHILNLIIHFELKNDQLLPYAIKSTTRFLKNRNKSYRFEEIFLSYLKKATKINNQFDYEELLENIGSELDEISQDPYESVALEYFDLKSWLTSKIKRKPFSEIKRTAFINTINAA